MTRHRVDVAGRGIHERVVVTGRALFVLTVEQGGPEACETKGFHTQLHCSVNGQNTSSEFNWCKGRNPPYAHHHHEMQLSGHQKAEFVTLFLKRLTRFEEEVEDARKLGLHFGAHVGDVGARVEVPDQEEVLLVLPPVAHDMQRAVRFPVVDPQPRGGATCVYMRERRGEMCDTCSVPSLLQGFAPSNPTSRRSFCWGQQEAFQLTQSSHWGQKLKVFH